MNRAWALLALTGVVAASRPRSGARSLIGVARRRGDEGLVITASGTTGPVTGIDAALFCGADSNTTPAATTGVFPISTKGDASIHATLALPSTCVAPIVVLNFQKDSTLITARYMALTGFTT